MHSLQGLLVVCKESDVEFFADYSDSDSEDTEITEAVSTFRGVEIANVILAQGQVDGHNVLVQ